MRSHDPLGLAGEHFDFVVIGSGFGASFFVRRLLHGKPGRILILEWGKHHPLDWQLANNRNSDVSPTETYQSQQTKPWNFTIALGGGMNCWYGQTPRFHPSDFKLNNLYGRGQDWPISYNDLEPYYCDAEDIMSVSGDPDMTRVLPRSRPFPQPAHRLTTPDEKMKAALPDRHFAMPTARARVATQERNGCCATYRCSRCPVDAKFTANNHMGPTYESSQVTLCLSSRVKTLVADNNSVSAAVFEYQGKEVRVTGDVFVLGANAIHSPAILDRSAMTTAMTGIGLHESYGEHVEVYLDGMDGLDGSTITTGLNYALYDGSFRSDYAAALVYFDSRYTHGLRTEPGRWRQIVPLMVVTEDLPNASTRVTAGSDGLPVVEFGGVSDYARVGQQRAFEKLGSLLSPLPVEAIHRRGERPTESHLQGTLRMGNDPQTSVVDANMIHHRYRNLVVVGSSVFPSCSCANPSLTVAALSLRAADRLVSSANA